MMNDQADQWGVRPSKTMYVWENTECDHVKGIVQEKYVRMANWTIIGSGCCDK